ncbi:hypothetical protein PAECIP111890_02147 [Paenibacillus sp. JJ-223]|nr:hypothetical protein PAECIP111890_02147 [Paenibacillus sp. JJ-223]
MIVELMFIIREPLHLGYWVENLIDPKRNGKPTKNFIMWLAMQLMMTSKKRYQSVREFSNAWNKNKEF